LESLGVQAVEQPTLEEGLALKERGMSLASLAEPEDFKQKARGVISYYASLGVPFTIEDVRETLGEDPAHFNVMGSLIAGAHRRGQIRPYGWTTAKRKERHACQLRTWVGV
jgi:hypothetical protein